jgi:hypothetical protein
MPPFLTLHDLKRLLGSSYAVLSAGGGEGAALQRALRAAANDLDRSLMTWSPGTGLVSATTARTVHPATEPGVLLRHLRSLQAPVIVDLGEFAPHLGDAAVARAFRETVTRFASAGSFLVVSASDGASLPLPPGIGLPITWRPAPQEKIATAVEACLRMLSAARRVRGSVDAPTRDAIVAALDGLTANQARQAVAAVGWQDGGVCTDSLPQLVECRARQVTESPALEWFPAEDNRFELGGFGRFKGWLPRVRAAMGPELPWHANRALKGVLLAGAEGCGKSLAVRVLARACGVPLVRVRAARLDRGLAGRQPSLADALTMAGDLAPAVLWIDRLEHLGEGARGADHLAALADWMAEPRAPVLVAATANDLWRVPRDLLTDRTFEQRFFVDLPDAAERDAIVRLHLTGRGQRVEPFDLASTVEASEGCRGGDVELAVIAVIQRSAHTGRAPDPTALVDELHRSVPLPVTKWQELERLREMARGRFVAVK